MLITDSQTVTNVYNNPAPSWLSDINNSKKTWGNILQIYIFLNGSVKGFTLSLQQDTVPWIAPTGQECS